MKQLLEHAICPGQQFAECYVFAPLPDEVVMFDKNALAAIGTD